MKKLAQCVLSLFALFLFSSSAFALHQHGNGVCHQDFQKYCSDKLGDKKAFKQCIHTNKAHFSQACQSHMAVHKQVMNSCKADIMKYCSADKGNKRAMMECMHENKTRFSTQCTSAMHKAHHAHGVPTH